MSGAVFFDGDAPVGQAVSARVAGESLAITFAGGRELRWPLHQVRQQRDVPGAAAVLRHTGDPLARLMVEDAALLSALPHRHRASPPKGRARLAGWAVAAVGAVAIQIFLLIPILADNLAGFIPAAGERALGEATFGQIRSALDRTGAGELPICEEGDGLAALEAVTARLTDGEALRQEVSVFVLDHEMVNAFALPGGFVVLFRGLIEAAGGPDEVTAVLAHEIGHVQSADPTRHALRSAGSIGILGLLFGDFAGGAAVLFLANQLISAQYSQAAERAADEYAHDALARAGIDPGALGDMFEGLRESHGGAGDAGGVTAHFLSHPQLGDRIAAARAATDEAVSYGPSMTDADWAALQAICD